MNEEMKNIIALKQRAEEMLKDDYSRKIGDEEIYTIICEWEKTFDLYDKEKEEKERYKRLAEANLKDGEEFRKNECEHRCIKNNEVLELKEELNKEKEKTKIVRNKIRNTKEEVADISLAQSTMVYTHKELVEQIESILNELLENI